MWLGFSSEHHKAEIKVPAELRFVSGGSGGKFISQFIGVIGRIQFPAVVVGLKSCFLAGCQPGATLGN